MLDIATHMIAFGAGGLFSWLVTLAEMRRWRGSLLAERVNRDELLLTERYLAEENVALKKLLNRAVVRDEKGRFLRARVLA